MAKKIKGLRCQIERKRNGQTKVYDHPVKHIDGNRYECPELGFTFDAETGETNKIQSLGGDLVKIGEAFKNASRNITYTVIFEEEQEEAKAETPTTLVEEWRYEDGTVETHKVYEKGQLWEKHGKSRLYLDSYDRGAYVDLQTNTFHPARRKQYTVGEWRKEWNAKVESRYILLR